MPPSTLASFLPAGSSSQLPRDGAGLISGSYRETRGMPTLPAGCTAQIPAPLVLTMLIEEQLFRFWGALEEMLKASA